MSSPLSARSSEEHYMAIDITMPALSPTMESGTLAKWHIKVGDTVKPGDVIAEIETDKATMEVESIDEGVVAEILVPEGAEDVKVNAVIARLSGEGETAAPAPKAAPAPAAAPAAVPAPAKAVEAAPAVPAAPAPAPVAASGARNIASPLARRVAQLAGVDLSTVKGTGPHGRIVKADVEAAAGRAPAAAQAPAAAPAAAAPAATAAPAAAPLAPTDVPHESVKLSNMRKTIARRLTESKQTVPHFYLTVDVRLDALLKLRGELNKSLEASGVKLSVNDMLLKAQALALVAVPDANVSFGGDHLRKFGRVDISVAVAIPGGLITPVIRDAANKRLSVIATEMKDLAARAKEGKLQPPEYTGGTASISNLGMYGIKQFDAVINPPEGLILAVGAGEKRPYVVDDALAIATVMSATGSFDHRAIDGAVGAEFMSAFKALVENPLGMLA
jgi:pyruvate dehydrogenase E2 component (dihydrolipoamide acetyltransferase)